MSSHVQVIVHEIAADGLPDQLSLDMGCVAFITNGCVVSGHPLIRGPGETRWEADPEIDSLSCCPAPVEGVTHWVEFPVPIEELTGG